MPQGRNTEEILRELIRSRGTEYLRKGNLFVNAVEDMGGAKGDVRLLRYLAEVDGASALLDAGGKPQAVRQTIYSQTVEKICDHALVSPEYSNKICAAFWRAVYNEAPPATYKGQEKPAPSPEPALKPAPAPQPESKPDSFPSEPVPPSPPEPSPRPTERKAKFALFRPEHSTAERWLLVLGWVCLANLIPMLYLIGIINSGSGISEFILPAFIFCFATILPIAYRQFYLWHQIIAWESPNAFLNIIWLVVEALGEFFGVFWLCIFALLLYGIFAAAPELTDVSELTFDVLFLMWYVFSLGFYFLSWSIWRRRRKKKA